MATLFRPTFTDKKTGQKKRLKKWYARVKSANGRVRKVPLSTNKAAAELMLGQLLAKIERQRVGGVDLLEAHAARPLDEHLADWAAALAAGGASAKHVADTVRLARRVVAGCGFALARDMVESTVQVFLADLRKPSPTAAVDPMKTDYTKAELAVLLGVKPSAVTPLVARHRLTATGNGKARRFPKATAEALLALRGGGMSVKSVNMHLAAAKQFCAWMVRNKRVADNPLAHLAGGDPESDRRKEFATLTADEIRRVIAAASTSSRLFRDLSGTDRAVLYAVAATTAVRPKELGTLTRGDFVLDVAVPHLRLGTGDTKNGKSAELALPEDVATELRTYLQTRPAAGRVWPGNWWKKAADMIRLDLPAADIPDSKPGPEGLRLDVNFYSLRHSAGLLAEQGGATIREVMSLMRHSDPKLTMKTYGRLRLEHLGTLAGKMPSLVPLVPVGMSKNIPPHVEKHARTGDSDGGREKTGDETSGAGDGMESLGLEATQGDLRPNEVSSPGRIRTYDPPVNSRLLYH